MILITYVVSCPRPSNLICILIIVPEGVAVLLSHFNSNQKTYSSCFADLHIGGSDSWLFLLTLPDSTSGCYSRRSKRLQIAQIEQETLLINKTIENVAAASYDWIGKVSIED